MISFSFSIIDLISTLASHSYFLQAVIKIKFNRFSEFVIWLLPDVSGQWMESFQAQCSPR